MSRLDHEWLRIEWIEKRTPQREIARIAGVSERTIRYHLRAAGLGPRVREKQVLPKTGRVSRYPLLNDREAISDRLTRGATLYALAKEIGSDRSAVRAALVRHGLTWERDRTPYSSTTA